MVYTVVSGGGINPMVGKHGVLLEALVSRSALLPQTTLSSRKYWCSCSAWTVGVFPSRRDRFLSGLGLARTVPTCAFTCTLFRTEMGGVVLTLKFCPYNYFLRPMGLLGFGWLFVRV